MRPATYLLCALLGAVAASAPRAAEAPVANASDARIDVHVDSRVELAAAMARLAGYDEYQAQGIVAYDRAVDAHFASFREHPSIVLMRGLRKERGIGYNAVVEGALVGSPDDWQPVLPLDPWPAGLDRRWDATSLRAFLRAANDFERDTGAAAFFASQRALQARAEASVRANLGQRLDIDWYRTQVPAQAIERFVVIPGLLDGLNSYAARIGTTLYGVLATPTFRDADDIDYPADAQLALLVHEFHHPSLNAWVDAHDATLSGPAERLFKVVEGRMRELAYGDPRILLYETMVRANTLSYLRRHGEAVALRRAIAEDRGKGFPWTPALSGMLDAGETDGAPRFTATTPARVAALLDAWARNDGALIEAEQRRFADEQARALAQGPQIEALFPREGGDAEAGDSVLELRFDRPMDGRISIFGDVPAVTGKPTWDDGKRVLRIPVRLDAGARYRLLLNNDEADGFTSAAGEKLTPRTWEFSVGAR